MKKAARHYGMRKVGSKGYDMGAKTGTAQRGDDTNNAWLVTMAPADKPEYVIVINRLHTSKIGKDLAPVAEDLYDLIFDKTEDSMER